MTTTNKPALVHFVRDGLSYRVSSELGHPAIVSRRGTVLEATDLLRELNTDPVSGFSFIDIAGDAEEQRRRWGSIFLGAGPLPAELATAVEEERAREEREARQSYNRSVATFGRN